MDELECMRAADEALKALTDDAAQGRVIDWLAAKYGRQPPIPAQPVARSEDPVSLAAANASGQIAGIAKLSQNGELQLTIRDLKAKSANDAAIRLVHVLIWATARLTGEACASSKSVVVPWLKKYRCYDGNTRGAIAQDKGIVREGDLLSLDFHAEQLAEKFVADILDPAIEGRWKPGSGTRKRAARSPRSEGVDAV